MKKQFLMTSLALAVALSLGGCGEKSTEEYLASANGLITQGDHKAAVIELKSAIQAQPEAAAPRLALGRLYLKLGDGITAEKELDKAVSFGTAKTDVVQDLARAAYLAGQAPDKALLQGAPSASAAPYAYVTLYQLLNAFDMGEIDDLGGRVTSYLETVQPADAKAIAEALQSILAKDVTGAVTKLQAVDASSPAYFDALMLKAKAHLSLNEMDKAAAALREYVAVVTGSNYAKLLLTETLVRADKSAEAEPLLTDLLARYPEQPLANYLQSVVSYAKKDFVKAKEYSEKALNNGMTMPNVRIMAALSALALDLNSQALTHLRQVKAEISNIPQLQKAYAMLELQAGNTDLAASVLSTGTTNQEDLKMIAAAAFELNRQGAVDQAAKLIQHVEKNIDKNVQNMAAVGMMKMNLQGQQESALQDLAEAVKLDPTVDQNVIALATAYLSAGQFDKIPPLFTGWLDNPQKAAVAHNLLGYSAYQQKKFDDALQHADKSLVADAKSAFPHLLKARVLLEKKDSAAGRQQIDEALKLQPDYLPALELKYQVTRGTTESLQVISEIDAILKKSPTNLPLRVLLASTLVDTNKAAEALAMLKLDTTAPERRPPLYWMTLIETMRVTNDKSGALQAAEDWVKLQPTDADAKFSLVRILTVSGQAARALPILSELRKRYPDNLRLQGAEVLLFAENQQFDKALQAFESMPGADQKTPDALFLKGRMLAAKRDFKNAIILMKQSYAVKPAEPVALALTDLIARNESPAAAISFLENHFSTQPKSADLSALYANLLLNIDAGKATKTFETLLQDDGDNVLALNNLAYLLTNQNKLQEAEGYAARALKLMPKHPDILDTYGVILLRKGEVTKAAEQFRLSLEQRPDHPEVSLNYAETLIKVGDKAAAKSILNKLSIQDPALRQRLEQLNTLL